MKIVNFLIESGISLSFLAAIYVIFLRKETFFKLNRFFLLGSVLFSIALPFFKFKVFEPRPVVLNEIMVTPFRNLLEAVTIYGKDLSGSVEQAILSTRLLVMIYIAGVLILTLLFLFRLTRILFLIRKNKVRYLNGIRLVVFEHESSPFSFMNTIFISRQLTQKDGYDKVIAHEMEHVKQGHTIDIIMLEVLAVFQWFNPFVWMLRRAIRENNEYLADNAVLTSGVNRGYYKKLLLEQFIGEELAIANHFNYSLIKKRIKMLSKIKSSKVSIVKFIPAVLVLVGLIIVFACEHKEAKQIEPVAVEEAVVKTVTGPVVEEKSDVVKEPEVIGDVFRIVEDMPEFPGGEQALKNYISNEVDYPEEAVEKEIQGKVFVTFVVTKNGKVANVKVERSADPILDKEAIRVISSLPEWNPGSQRGTDVNVQLTVPISFKLN